MYLSDTQVISTGMAGAQRRFAKKQSRLSTQILSSAALMTDMLLQMVALSFVLWLQRRDVSFTSGETLLAGLGSGLATCLVLSRCGAYRLERLSGKMPWFGLLLGGICIGACVLGLQLALLPTVPAYKSPAIGIPVCTWAALALLLLSGSRGLSIYLLSIANLSDALRRRVAVVGANEFGRAFIEHVANDPNSGIRIVGLYTEMWDDIETASASGHVEGNLKDLAERCSRDDVDAIVLATSLLDTVRIDRIRYALRNVIADIYITADIAGLRFGVADLQAIGRSPVVRLQRRPLDEWQQLQKAIFDRLLGSMLMLLLLPVFLLVAIIIRLDSPGPVFFRQPRLGFNNRTFMVYKFRSMSHHSDPMSLNGGHQARQNDPRITRVGKWLRRYSIDELPQLINVMKGEMSLVGPRPHPLNTRVGDQLFQEVVDNYATRHRMLPGITGWAQVNGWRGETIVAEQIQQRVAHDLYYIENWSLALDFRILLLTVAREIISKKAF
jgi:Undecaprenyl-phosphate glucose phosphotransferase